jgi:DedD protein
MTAAYAIDPLLLDVSTRGGGEIVLTGRSTGSTQLIAITAGGSKAFLVTVGPPRAVVLQPNRTADGSQPFARYEGRYASDSGQFQNAFDVFTRDGDRRTNIHLVNVHYFHDRFGRDATAFPSVWYRVTTTRREVTFLDDFVDVSPLTLRATQLRGFHVVDDHLEIHAGYAASTLYEDLFLPSDRRWTAGAGYAIRRGDTKWIPTVYGFFSQPENTSARRGVVASLIAEERRGEAFFARGEIGVSRSAGGAFEFRYDTDRDRAHGRAFFKPSNFPTLGLSDLAGLHADGDWTHRATTRFTIDSFGGYDRFRLANAHDTTANATVDLRYALTPHVTIDGGAAITSVTAANADFRTLSLPVGLAYDTPRFGSSVSYRTIENSAASRRGDALRLSLRAGTPSLQANLWAERQRQAPTLSLIFNSTPGLELALLRLGISVRSPEDLARVLRDDAVLVNLGYLSGVEVNLAPKRLQGGFDVAWNPENRSRTQLRLHAIYSRDEGIAVDRDGLLATFSMSRRLTDDADLFAAYSWWRTRALPFDDDGTSVEVGLRTQFDRLPSFVQRRGAIRGIVFLDPELGGHPGGATTPIADIAVTLDGQKTTRTDSRGGYSFGNLQPGPHRVAAQLPGGRAAFFTTPSRVETDAPSEVNFGLVWSPARLAGRVVSDANLGIAGTVVAIAGTNGLKLEATTDLEGAFTLAMPPGEYHATLAAESLPPGYVVAGEGERTLHLAADAPQQTAFEVHALRSISGSAGAAGAEIELQPLGRRTTADGNGNYAFRSLPAGTFTLVARTGSKTATRNVTLPAEPATLHAIDLGAESLAAAHGAPTPPAPGTTPRSAQPPAQPSAQPSASPPQIAASTSPSQSPPPIAASPASPSPEPPVAASTSAESGKRALGNAGSFRIYVGAYRLAENAEAAKRDVARLGLDASVAGAGSLQVVSVGPYATRDAAERDASRLAASGLETFVAGSELHGAATAPEPSGKAFVVQIGAFREAANVRQLTTRLHRLGHRSFTRAVDGLTLVAVGPFPTRRAASSASERLRSAGFETLVVGR